MAMNGWKWCGGSWRLLRKSVSRGMASWRAHARAAGLVHTVFLPLREGGGRRSPWATSRPTGLISRLSLSTRFVVNRGHAAELIPSRHYHPLMPIGGHLSVKSIDTHMSTIKAAGKAVGDECRKRAQGCLKTLPPPDVERLDEFDDRRHEVLYFIVTAPVDGAWLPSGPASGAVCA